MIKMPCTCKSTIHIHVHQKSKPIPYSASIYFDKGCCQSPEHFLTLVMLNPDIPCLCKPCRSRSVGFWRSQLIWICTVCHYACEFIATIPIKLSDWLKIRSGHGNLIYSAGQCQNPSESSLYRSTVSVDRYRSSLWYYGPSLYEWVSTKIWPSCTRQTDRLKIYCFCFSNQAHAQLISL